MKQLALAVHNYESANGTFPMGRNNQAYISTRRWSAGIPRRLGPVRSALALHRASPAVQCDQHQPRPYQLSNSTFPGIGITTSGAPATPWSSVSASSNNRPAGTARRSASATPAIGESSGRSCRAPTARQILAGRARDVSRYRRPDLVQRQSQPGAGEDRRYHRRHEQHLPLRRERQGKLSQVGCGPGGGCPFEGNGWWADADFGDSTMSHVLSAELEGRRRHDPARQLRPGRHRRRRVGHELPSRRMQLRLRRRLGPVHQGLDQLVELGLDDQPTQLANNCIPVLAGRPADAGSTRPSRLATAAR